MDLTKYLKELRKQNKLPELLRKLGLPNTEVKTSNHECTCHFLPNSLTIVEWKNFPAYNSERTDFYEINDYMFISGVRDHNQVKLQKLFDYMKEHFSTYTKDCIHYLQEQQRQKKNELQANCDKEKQNVEHEFNKKIDRVLRNK